MLTPPASAQPRPSDAIQTWTHASGAQVFLVEKHDFPYVTWNVTLRTGGLWDPTDKVGLASLTLNMLPRGAGTRDREAIEAELDQLGAAFASDVGRIAMELDGDAIRRNLDDVMEIVGELLTHPTFPPEELEKLKRQREAEIKRVRDNDQTLNGRFFRRYLFGPHPWGQPSDGTLAGIANVQLADVQAFYKAHVVASNIIFGFSGDVTRADIDKLLDAHFADLPRGEAPALTLSAHPKLTGRQVLLVDKPDRTQNQILIGHFAPTSDSPDLYALDVVNTIFGGTFTARLNHEVRDQRGLSYGAYSSMDHDPFAGVFSMSTYPASEDALKTVNLLVELFEQRLGVLAGRPAVGHAPVAAVAGQQLLEPRRPCARGVDVPTERVAVPDAEHVGRPGAAALLGPEGQVQRHQHGLAQEEPKHQGQGDLGEAQQHGASSLTAR